MVHKFNHSSTGVRVSLFTIPFVNIPVKQAGIDEGEQYGV